MNKPASVHDDRRNSVRYRVAIDGTLKSSKGSTLRVTITDMSNSGCGVDLGTNAMLDAVGYAIKVPGLETLGAQLCWSGWREAGLRFERSLHPAVLDHVIASSVAAQAKDVEPA